MTRSRHPGSDADRQAEQRFQKDMRAFMALRATPMVPDDQRSAYMLLDHEADNHVRSYGGGCHWVIPEDAKVDQRFRAEFSDTWVEDPDDDYRSGLEVRGVSCACGRWQGIDLRWTGTMAEAVAAIAREFGPRMPAKVVKV